MGSVRISSIAGWMLKTGRTSLGALTRMFVISGPIDPEAAGGASDSVDASGAGGSDRIGGAGRAVAPPPNFDKSQSQKLIGAPPLGPIIRRYR
jgi:hypothetical protein